MDFHRVLRIEEGFNSAPQEPESRTGIDDEHPVQRLQIKKEHSLNITP